MSSSRSGKSSSRKKSSSGGLQTCCGPTVLPAWGLLLPLAYTVIIGFATIPNFASFTYNDGREKWGIFTWGYKEGDAPSTRLGALPYAAPDGWPDKLAHAPAVLLAQFVFTTFLMFYVAALALFAVRLKPREYIFGLPVWMYALSVVLALGVLACGTMDLAFWLIVKPTADVSLTVLGWFVFIGGALCGLGWLLALSQIYATRQAIQKRRREQAKKRSGK